MATQDQLQSGNGGTGAPAPAAPAPLASPLAGSAGLRPTTISGQHAQQINEFKNSWNDGANAAGSLRTQPEATPMPKGGLGQNPWSGVNGAAIAGSGTGSSYVAPGTTMGDGWNIRGAAAVSSDPNMFPAAGAAAPSDSQAALDAAANQAAGSTRKIPVYTNDDAEFKEAWGQERVTPGVIPLAVEGAADDRGEGYEEAWGEEPAAAPAPAPAPAEPTADEIKKLQLQELQDLGYIKGNNINNETAVSVATEQLRRAIANGDENRSKQQKLTDDERNRYIAAKNDNGGNASGGD